jgi:hypothetical protein
VAEGSLADLLAVAMVGVSVFCAGRLVLGFALRRPAERDVDAVHLVMGISMAGMLTGWLRGTWNDVWLLAFAASAAWFGWGALRAAHGWGAATSWLSGGAHASHLVGSATMLYMIVAMRWVPTRSAGMHGMAPAASGIVLPTVLATMVVANALFVTIMGLRPVGAALPSAAGSTSPPSAAVPVRSLAPRGAHVCLVVMSVAMAYMLVTVRP